MREHHFLPLLLLAALLASHAQAQDDLGLMTTVVPPNVMILFDNSGSMSHAMWHPGFDQGVFHDVGAVAAACNISSVPAIAGSAGFCPGSGDAADQCPSNGSSWSATSVVRCDEDAFTDEDECSEISLPGFSCWETGGQLRFRLPDYTPGGTRTRWSRNYLHWLFGELLAGNVPAIPDTDRMETARSAILDLVDLINPDGFNDNVRFGLAKFKSGSDPSGGSIDAPVSTGNKNALIARINNLQPGGWTPLAESLVDIGDYLTGDNSVGSCSAAGNIGNSNPMDDYCRKNFVIVLTDGEPTKDDFSNSPGTADFVCKIGNADFDTDEVPTPGNGRTDAPPYGSQGTDWLDDVAYAFYDRDLRADLQDKQNIITYTIGFTIDHPLLSDAAVNSTGFYYIANDADELAATLHAAVLDIIERATSFSAATVPSSRTAFADGFYLGWFTPRSAEPFWDGHLEAYRLSATLEVLDKDGAPALDIDGNFLDPKNPFWDVSDRLVDPLHPARSIFTTLTGARTDFTTGTIDAAHLNVLPTELNLYPNDPLVPFADTEALTDALVDYLYGHDAFDSDRDTDTAELREFVLGDIFHSSPILVGPPPFALASEEGFGPPELAGSFLGQFAKRERRLYVGANDGMLHAIEAGQHQLGDNAATPEIEDGYYDMGSGNEDFAWIPGMLLDTLKFIPRNLPRRYYYVDGSPTAGDAWFPSGPSDVVKSPNEWATVLLTGMRQGGPGYLALDVTDPTAIAGPHGPYPKLLWEFDDSTGEPLGESWSNPIITRVRMRGSAGLGDHCAFDDGEGDCREQWVAIFAGGYRDDGDPNMPTWLADPLDPLWDAASKAVFIVALDTGQVLARLAYDPVDPQLQKMVFSLASTPAVLDLDFDGFADLIYVGDAGGQLWKWDISAIGQIGPSTRVDNWPYGVFFQAPSASISGGGTHYKSIFFPPSAAFVNNGDMALAFGTGSRTNLTYQGDNGADDNNRYYKILDPEPLGPASIPVAPYTEANLTDITGLPDDPDPTDLGYFFVAQESEKFVTNHIIFGGFVITTSYLPDDGSGGVCSLAGTAFVHVFSLETGAGFFDPADSNVSGDGRTLLAGVGVPSDPRITTSGDGSSKLFVQTSIGSVVALDAPPGGGDVVDIVYWKQDL